jgi:hypothetical protein
VTLTLISERSFRRKDHQANAKRQYQSADQAVVGDRGLIVLT